MELPTYVQIEPVGQCNLRCQMCSIQFRQDGPPAFMDFSHFTQIIDQFTTLRELHLQGLGEPMMHPRFFEMIEYAASKGIQVSTNSNLTHLSVLVTNDTGPAHIAYALNAPTVVIFGGDSPLNNGPLQRGPFRVLAHQIPCRPYGYATCPIGYQCLKGIDSEQVLAAIESVMH